MPKVFKGRTSSKGDSMTVPQIATAPEAEFDECQREAIHTPDAIQPHGVLIVASTSDLRISHVSANFARSTGIASKVALGSELAEIIGGDAAGIVRDALKSELYAPTNVLTLDLSFKRDRRRNLVVHTCGGYVFLELELASSSDEQEHIVSRIQTVIATLRETSSIIELCKRTADALRYLTGYDRVMVYRFDRDGHGEVIAENRRDDLEPYLNLRYPASDIPHQARQLYLKQRVRVIADVAYKPVPLLVDAGHSDTSALDMSYCGLRSVSPFHLQYLANMGVGATLAVSLIQDSTLWGMIVCHHLTPRMVPTEIKGMCDLIGQLVTLLIAKADERECLAQLVAGKEVLATLKHSIELESSIAAGLLAKPAALMDLVGATGAAVRLSGRVHLVGITPTVEESDAIITALRALTDEGVLASESLCRLSPSHAAMASIAAGVLLLPILNNPGDAIAWFRPEVARTVVWGGDPNKATQVDAITGRVSPRRSFAAWRELLKGTSVPWTAAEGQAAQDLRKIIAAGMLHFAESQLAQLSMLDPLTGLANRRCLEEELKVWGNSSTETAAALLFLDLDRFKTVNDSLGHAAGDELLMQVGMRLKAAAPKDCLVARLGGDEFVILVKGEAAGHIDAIVASVLDAFDNFFRVSGRPHRTSASLGVAQARQPGVDLLRQADLAMYSAKRQGGRQMVGYDTTQHDRAVKMLRIEQDMFLALGKREFVLHYQPIIDLSVGGLCGFEALVRWQHATNGWIQPGDFIPLAEETGFINDLGCWILETGVNMLASLPDPTLCLAINVSPRQLTSDDFLERMNSLLRRSNLPPQRLTIEVTESALMNVDAVARLHRLRETGCRIAIDDFGTGYSSLSYLRTLPVDILKIDRCFVTPLGRDDGADRFLKAIVGLARTCDLTVVAEGVETEEQLKVVCDAGCDKAQGFLFSKAVPAESARGWRIDRMYVKASL